MEMSPKKKYPKESFNLKDQTNLDMEKIQEYHPSHKFFNCPTGGRYLLIGKIPICSVHGMNFQPCPEDTR